MKVEVLYIADCPNHPPVVDRVREVLRSAGMSEIIEEVEVCTSAEAEALQFIGSPTVRVNGLDVEPEARTVHHFGLGCRSYVDNDRRSGLPSKDLIRRSLPDVQNGSQKPGATTFSKERDTIPRKEAGAGVLFAGGVAAILASTCCLGPLILVTLGFTGAWIGNLTLLEPYRPWFIAAALVALFFAARRIFRPVEACTPGEVCALPKSRRAYKALFSVVAVLVVVAFAFPYVAQFFY